jgi:hypothetical protein
MPEISLLEQSRNELYDCSICLRRFKNTSSTTSRHEASRLEIGNNVIVEHFDDLKEFWQKYCPPGMEDVIEKPDVKQIGGAISKQSHYHAD